MFLHQRCGLHSLEQGLPSPYANLISCAKEKRRERVWKILVMYWTLMKLQLVVKVDQRVDTVMQGDTKSMNAG